MKFEYKKIPKIIKKKEYYLDGANAPTMVDVHKCFCLFGRGTVETNLQTLCWKCNRAKSNKLAF